MDRGFRARGCGYSFLNMVPVLEGGSFERLEVIATVFGDSIWFMFQFVED